MKKAVLVISGPSGSGKTTLAKTMCSQMHDSYFSISTTTRSARENEKDGVDYYFVSKEDFLEQIGRGDFLEWAEVHGNFYGTSLKKISEAFEAGKVVVLDIDVQGHRSIKEKYGGYVTSVFITTKNLSTLKERLELRSSESKEALERRVINAFGEMRSIGEYDYLVINDDFEHSLVALKSIAIAARYKQTKYDLDEFIEQWRS